MPEIDKRAGKVFSNKLELPKPRAANPVQSGKQKSGCHWGDPKKLREHFTRLDSIMMSKRKAKPEWWCKEYEDGKMERKEWTDLMKPMSMEELVEAVKSVQAGKSAGPDRLSADMIKYLFWGRRESEAGQPNVTRPGVPHAKWIFEDNPTPNACNESYFVAV
jgi:hypothetical protein